MGNALVICLLNTIVQRSHPADMNFFWTAVSAIALFVINIVASLSPLVRPEWVSSICGGLVCLRLSVVPLSPFVVFIGTKSKYFPIVSLLACLWFVPQPLVYANIEFYILRIQLTQFARNVKQCISRMKNWKVFIIACWFLMFSLIYSNTWKNIYINAGEQLHIPKYESNKIWHVALGRVIRRKKNNSRWTFFVKQVLKSVLIGSIIIWDIDGMGACFC